MQIQQGSDKVITHKINRQLDIHGLGSPSKVAVDTRSGEVTLSGSVQYFHQKKAVIGVTIGVTGVRRIVDEADHRCPHAVRLPDAFGTHRSQVTE